MSLNRYDKRCPECGSADLDERGRVEGGFNNPTGEDTAIIECQQCRHVWDTEMAYLVPVARCGASAEVWLSQGLVCIRHRGHKGTIHEDETGSTWDAEELDTTFPDE